MNSNEKTRKSLPQKYSWNILPRIPESSDYLMVRMREWLMRIRCLPSDRQESQSSVYADETIILHK